MKMELTYLYLIEFKYLPPFETSENFVHGFYSKSKDTRYVKRSAKQYMKKHRIPCEIVDISAPETKLLMK